MPLSSGINVPDMRPRSPGRPTQNASVELHERIVRAALEEFLAKGFGAASIEGIARAAAVHKDTIYRQFGTKERLYRAGCQRAFESMQLAMPGASSRSSDVAKTLADVMRRIHRTFTTPRAQAIVSMSVTQAALFPDLAAAAREDTQAYLKPLAEYLRRLHESGTLTLDDPEEAAEMLATAVLGGVRFMFEPSLRGEALDAFVDRRLRIFLSGWNYRPRHRESRRARRSAG